MPQIIVAGDDFEIAATLTKSNSTFVIPTSADVQCVFQIQGSAIHVPVTANSTAMGADWDNSLVVFAYNESTSDELAAAVGKTNVFEVQVHESGSKTTWRQKNEFEVHLGAID